MLRLVLAVQGLGVFALITFGVILTKFNFARRVMRPLLYGQIARCGVALLPMASFLSLALGLIIIGQTLSALTRVGAQGYLGAMMVTVVLRELGPALVAALVLSRVGTATVVELGTARAAGEVEALEGLGIDPIHYLVVPRVIGMAIATFALTIYVVLGAIFSGYLWALIEGVPLTLAEYFRQLAAALTSFDFALLVLKPAGFGIIVSIISCYQGLARPLRIGDVAGATARAVGQSIVFCGVLDVSFIAVSLLL